MECKKYRIIITGTDPDSRRGGIGHALPGYLAALDSVKIPYQSIPTYSPSDFFGRYLMFLFVLPEIYRSIIDIRNTGRICIVYSHAGADISLLREGLVLLLSRFAGAKTVMQIHSPETISYLKSFLKGTLFRLAIYSVDEIFLLSPWWKRTYRQFGIIKNMEVISNPLPPIWEKKAKHDVHNYSNGDSLRILVMTRMVQGKGADLIVAALPYLPATVKVSIAGDGALLSALKKRVSTLGQDDKVTFHGWVSGKEKQDLIDGADLFCHPTQLDAMPMNILEAMANGLPIVALNWGPIPDLVPDQKVGFLVTDPDPEAIAKAIEKLDDPVVRESMGKAAKRWVLDNYTASKVGENLQNAFSKFSS
jgi:glycosyltransferase involved in cell wall biosynthesis